MTGDRILAANAALLGLLALAVWGLLWLTGALIDRVGLGDFPVITQFAVVFGFLTLAERVLARRGPH